MRKTIRILSLLITVIILLGFVVISCGSSELSSEKENKETNNSSSNNINDNTEKNEDENDDEETPNYDQKKNPIPLKNFTVTQKEGTNILVFKWELFEEEKELEYYLTIDSEPKDSGLMFDWYEHSNKIIDDAITDDSGKKITYEYLVGENGISHNLPSGSYTFSIQAHEGNISFDNDEKLSSTVEYARIIHTPSLEIQFARCPDPSTTYTEAMFNISSTLLSTGNQYCMVYIGKTNDIKEAEIAAALELYGDNKKISLLPKDDFSEITKDLERFFIKCPVYNSSWNKAWDKNTIYYMWLKLADEYAWESSGEFGHLVDSDTYSPASNVAVIDFNKMFEDMIPKEGIKAQFKYSSYSDTSYYVNFYEDGTFVHYSYDKINRYNPRTKGTYMLTGTFDSGSFTIVQTARLVYSNWQEENNWESENIEIQNDEGKISFMANAQNNAASIIYCNKSFNTTYDTEYIKE